MSAKTVLSSKGQIVIPAGLRAEAKLKKGTEIVIEKTSNGLLLIPVPENPVAALRGILKGSKVSSGGIKRMRREDDKKRFAKLNF